MICLNKFVVLFVVGMIGFEMLLSEEESVI